MSKGFVPVPGTARHETVKIKWNYKARSISYFIDLWMPLLVHVLVENNNFYKLCINWRMRNGWSLLRNGDFMFKLVLLRKNVHFSKFVPLLPSPISVPPAWWYSILLLLASLLIQMRLFLSIDLPLLLFQLRPVIIPLSAPKKYWRQPFGALLLKSLVYCVTDINHLGFTRLFSLMLKDNVVQASAASMYTEKNQLQINNYIFQELNWATDRNMVSGKTEFSWVLRPLKMSLLPIFIYHA